MNEKNLHLIDYLLALIPAFIFIFPIAFFIVVLLDLLDYNTFIIPLSSIIVTLFFIFAWGIWSWKLTFKPRSKKRSVYIGFWLADIDISALIFILWQLSVLENLIGTYQVIWEIFMGFISIILVTVLADFHKLPDVYSYSMEWIQSKIY